MGFYIVNDITVNCKNVQLFAEATDNYCVYQNIGVISKWSQDITYVECRGVVARCVSQGNPPSLLSTDEGNSFGTAISSVRSSWRSKHAVVGRCLQTQWTLDKVWGVE